MPANKMNFGVVRQIALAFPDVREGSSWGAPSLKVRGKFLACPAMHSSAEPNTLVLSLNFDLRAELLAREPDIYYLTDHYVNHPTVLVRLPRITRSALTKLLRTACQLAPAAQPKPSKGHHQPQIRSPKPRPRRTPKKP